MNTPLEYAKNACDTMMRKFPAGMLPPLGHFHYHQGVFLSGVNHTYQLCEEEKYFQYIKDWIDSVFDENAHIRMYTHADLDDIQPGILLYPILDKTGDAYYQKAIESVFDQVKDIRLCKAGGFWHKTCFPNQMWTDGLYMSGPFCLEYAKRMNRPDIRDLIIRQALLMEEKTRDDKTGLLYHAWDETKTQAWANKETGRSSEFWGRSIGWVPVALLDDLDFIEEGVPGRERVARMACELLTALCRYQSEDGRWYQVVDKGGMPGNWLETSCTCLYVAALCKAVRLALMPDSYTRAAMAGYEGVIRSLTWIDEDVQIGNVCVGTNVGNDYQYYCDRPTSVNDLHGVGAFLLMCTQVERLMNTGKV